MTIVPKTDVEQTILIYTPLGMLFKEASKEASTYASNKEAFWEPF
jgi:hypothetical protein